MSTPPPRRRRPGDEAAPRGVPAAGGGAPPPRPSQQRGGRPEPEPQPSQAAARQGESKLSRVATLEGRLRKGRWQGQGALGEGGGGASQADLDRCILHVRGIGGALEQGSGAALTTFLGRHAPCEHAAIRHRVDPQTGENTSWALATMSDPAGADLVLQAQMVSPEGKPLVITRYSARQASESKGAMQAVSAEVRGQLRSTIKSALALKLAQAGAEDKVAPPPRSPSSSSSRGGVAVARLQKLAPTPTPAPPSRDSEAEERTRAALQKAAAEMAKLKQELAVKGTAMQELQREARQALEAAREEAASNKQLVASLRADRRKESEAMQVQLSELTEALQAARQEAISGKQDANSRHADHHKEGVALRARLSELTKMQQASETENNQLRSQLGELTRQVQQAHIFESDLKEAHRMAERWRVGKEILTFAQCFSRWRTYGASLAALKRKQTTALHRLAQSDKWRAFDRWARYLGQRQRILHVCRRLLNMRLNRAWSTWVGNVRLAVVVDHHSQDVELARHELSNTIEKLRQDMERQQQRAAKQIVLKWQKQGI
jgi:hypothetical protein